MRPHELEDLVRRLDAEMSAENVPLRARPIVLLQKLATTLKTEIRNDSPLFEASMAILNKLYTRTELAIGPLLRGGFLFRDSIYEVTVPVIYGSLRLDLREFMRAMPESRRAELVSSRDDWGRFIDQICDLFDLGQGLDDVGRRSGFSSEALELLQAGRSQLEAAVSTAVLGPNRESAAPMHCCFLAAELFLKGALANGGVSHKALKRLGHELPALVDAAVFAFNGLDKESLKRAIAQLPKGVEERYSTRGYTGHRLGHAIMSVQAVGGALLREVSGRDLRKGLNNGKESISLPRTYP